MTPTPTRWQRLRPLLAWAGTAAGLGYIAHVIDLREAASAFSRISVGALALAILCVGANVVVGAARWRVLLAAYGAESRPSLGRATKLYFIAFFYNNYLPGAVAGDVVRGVVTRDVFGARGATAGLAVVLVERALGFCAMFCLLAIGVAAADIDTGRLWLWSAIGISGSLALVLALPFARRLAPMLPRSLRAIAERVPSLSSGRAFALAAACSIATQLFVTTAGWILLRAIDPAVDFGSALLVVPLAAATAFLPITVGGAGAREAVYIALGAQLFHMSEADAGAAALALWLANLANGALGGLLQITERRRSAK